MIDAHESLTEDDLSITIHCDSHDLIFDIYGRNGDLVCVGKLPLRDLRDALTAERGRHSQEVEAWLGLLDRGSDDNAVEGQTDE